MTAEEMKRRFPFQKNTGNKRCVLLCFHHAGGSAVIFKDWVKFDFPFEVIPVEIPGRGTRQGENCITDFGTAVRNLAEDVRAVYEDRKLCLFGHSLGSIIAFEVAGRLREYDIDIKKLFVAGRVSPDREEPSSYRCAMGMERLKEELLRIGATPQEVLDDAGFNREFLPMIYSDYMLSEDYRYGDTKVDFPIIAFNGTEDPDADMDMMRGWRNMTDGEFRQYQFDGSHFFPYEKEGKKLLKTIYKEIMMVE